MQVEEFVLQSGSGTTVQEINKFIASYEMTQKMMRKMKDEKNIKKMMNSINPNDLKRFK